MLLYEHPKIHVSQSEIQKLHTMELNLVLFSTDSVSKICENIFSDQLLFGFCKCWI